MENTEQEDPNIDWNNPLLIFFLVLMGLAILSGL
jgi:hypothetical protein